MTYHVPIMAEKVIEGLKVESGKVYLDCTLGGGGHTRAITQAGGKVVAIDRDQDAIEYCKTTLSGDVTYIKGKYEDARELLASNGIDIVDGVLMDLGVSSHQLDVAERGFSYMRDGRLDMRMDRDQALSAYDVVNGYSESDLRDILFRYGEESFSRKIAAAIVRERAKEPISSTARLAEIISSEVPHRKGAHPAKKSFQAIRIEVNGELNGLYDAVTDVFSLIKSGGRLCVITFHSLEDRIVKSAFKECATDCICPKNFPVCVCNHHATGRIIGKYYPADDELQKNPRSASSTLRIIEKL